MNDSDGEVTLPFLARVAGIFLVAFLAAVIVLHLSGCSSTPAPLTVADIASNSFSDEIDTHVAAWKRRVKADADRGELACKSSDMACRKKAVDDAIAAHAAEQKILDEIAVTQHLLQGALSTAKLCKAAADVACAGGAFDTAVARSSELRTMLASYYREFPR